MTLSQGISAAMVEQPIEVVRRGPGRPCGSTSPETRERIVRFAREVFSQRGYYGTTVLQVAERAQVSRPLVSHYFPGKIVLYKKVMEATYADVLAPAVERAVQETTLMRQLSVFLDVAGQAVAGCKSAGAFLCTSVAECQYFTELQDPEHDPVTAIRQFLTWAVDGAVQRGELPADTDTGALVESLVALVSGVGYYAGFLGSERQVRAVTEILKLLISR